MKIIAILEDDAASGGAFNQALNAIAQMRDLCAGRYEFEVLTTRASNLRPLHDLGVRSGRFAFSVLDKLFAYLADGAWWQSAQARLSLTAPFEKMLLRRGCDLVYFLSPSTRPRILQRLNYITTVWDLCHRDVPEFPETRAYGRFALRERLFHTVLPPATLVLADSEALAASVARRYGVDPERVIAMPFAPAPTLAAAASRAMTSVLETYGLEEGYYFYPAQFWAHKNHIRILQALRILTEDGHRPRVVFAGGDAGNLAHVEGATEAHALRGQVRVLGFVPAEDMRGLYEACLAVVMPTYFGPTNVPPLEAWMMDRPLVYSSRFGEQAGDAALYADPDDARALADAMHACTDPAVRTRLIEAGRRKLRQAEHMRKDAGVVLLERLRKFEARRACWP